jgi:hypothetical protein
LRRSGRYRPGVAALVVRRYIAMTTPDTDISHPAEFEALRGEITLYQQEMHRTWLWAIIPAGMVYTWLASRPAQSGSPPPAVSPLPWVVWFIPAVFVLLCGIRYLVFSCRINHLADYQCRLEEAAFGTEKRLPGIARCNRRHPLPVMSIVGSWLVWAGLLTCSIYLSCTLSQKTPMLLIAGLGLTWMALGWLLYRYFWRAVQQEPNQTGSEPDIARALPISSPAPILAAPLPSSPPVASPPTTLARATSVHKRAEQTD